MNNPKTWTVELICSALMSSAILSKNRVLKCIQFFVFCSVFLMPSFFEGSDTAAFAQEREPEDPMIRSLFIQDSSDLSATASDMDIFSFGLEIIPTPGAGSFFSGYSRLFGRTRTLDAYVSPTLVGRVRLGEQFRLVFGSSYMGSGFNEIYNALRFPQNSPDMDTLVEAAQVFEDFSIRALPIVLGFQYSPIRAQFTSYVGAAAGVAFVTTDWTSDTRPFENSAYFRPETNVDGPSIAPAFRVFTGLDLRFDRFFRSENFFRGIYIEAAYFYLPVTRNYFEEIRTISRGAPTLPTDDKGTLNLGGLTISIGANMQLLRR